MKRPRLVKYVLRDHKRLRRNKYDNLYSPYNGSKETIKNKQMKKLN